MPENGSSLVAATRWIGDLVTGTVGVAAAVLAVATVGLLMLSGRLPALRGVTAVVGCFVLFSAGTIADGLLADKSRACRLRDELLNGEIF